MSWSKEYWRRLRRIPESPDYLRWVEILTRIPSQHGRYLWGEDTK
jgi:hypothetical protein